ncbi:sigma-E factor negative regulatory protein [Shewanella marina]|uniref:sigma-E factor negative regulatory protein n=1 Tax=Shewanella marina TaxID=487319 RepID=UPI00046FBCCA|nr:RseA family anti-sigma factor [Shewanella marina]
MDKLGQEWVSAAVDGESDANTLAELAADKSCHDQWRNYHLIGDTLRNELPATIDLDLSARIAMAIDDEPAIVAPQVQSTTQADESKSKSKVVPLFKQFGQYAIAASVALVAVVGVQNYNQTDAGVNTAPLPVLTTRPLVGSASPVSFQTEPSLQQQEYSNEQVADQRRRVNAYIQDHMFQQRLNPGLEISDNSALPKVSGH